MMDDDRSSDARIPSEGWAEIEAAEREVERKDAASQQKLEQQAKDPAIQRGVEARFVEQLDEYLGPPPTRSRR